MSEEHTAERAAPGRVLVVLDTIDELAAVPTAAHLARHLQAELAAVFVEDASLLELAALPFAREVVRETGASRDLEADRLTRALHRQGEQVRVMLEGCARESSIRCSFRVVRGAWTREVLSAPGEHDVLVLASARPRSATPVRKAAVAGWLRALRSASRPVWVLFDGSDAARHALALAASITDPLQQDLVVMLPPADRERLREAAGRILGDRAPSARFATLDELSPAAVFAIVHGNGCSAVLLPRHEELVRRAVHDAWPAALGCAVVVVP